MTRHRRGYPTGGSSVSLRKGNHDALISFQTYRRIQERLEGKAKVPARKNLNEDFPLRGFVSCTDCGAPMTAYWAKGRSNRYPYYECKKKGCSSYGKTFKREVVESEFEDLLRSLIPTPRLFRIVELMFRDLWDQRLVSQEGRATALKAEMARTEQRIAQMLDRAVDASSQTLAQKYEERIEALEHQKLEISEKIAQCGRPIRDYDETLRTAMTFLGNPHKLWASGGYMERRAVLKLTFSDRLAYGRNGFVRTATSDEIALPFKMLGDLSGENIQKSRLASPGGFEPPLPP